MPEPPAPLFTPVNLITGFLGAGKTTLLQKLLADPALADTAVLINEFGEVGLDHHLLERIDDTMVLLQSGCVCCTIRGDLSAAIRDLHGKRERGKAPRFRRLVIESTGLADPFPILSTVQADPVLRHHFRLGNVITTVDAVNALRQLARQPESTKQVAVADRLVLTKTDLAEAAEVELLVERLRRLNPSAPLWRSAEGPVDAAALLAHDVFATASRSAQARRWLAAELEAAPPPVADRDPNRHDETIHTFTLTLDGAVDWTAFGLWLTMLLHRHGERVLRVKGILNVTGSATPVAIHGVQHLVHPPVHMAAWPDGPRSSRLVFIVDGLDARLIERSLASFLGLVPAVLSPAA
ncbi:CobW family GTP-binding protein [Reyranella sp.]|uniref:CobW family GTP-binding protein n=1 Tax=Reyranella sp. TaxID=1929291 RepID=UPI003BA9686E